MKAVIKVSGSQYLVSEGQNLTVDRMDSQEKVVFPEVLMTLSESEIRVGTPNLPDVTITAEKIGDVSGDKVRIFKYKAKSRYRKTVGFRPKFTRFKILTIGSGSEKKS